MAAGRTFVAVVGAVAIAAVVVFFGVVRQPHFAPIAPPKASAFTPAAVKKGAALAALGDCDVCHTAPGGKSFAGGLPIKTPFGVIYSMNITPDATTGIGRWSEAAFRRAMREGVTREGTYLYPAFPFDHFTHASDQDIAAIYAFLMTRQPVRTKTPADRLEFPISLRFVMAGWDVFFLHKGPLANEQGRSAEWNRGRYLVAGLGHCGACHTPRNSFGAEDGDRAFAGANAENWLAPALNSASPDPIPWTTNAIYHYLKTDFQAQHSFAAGPMGPVVSDLRRAPDADLRAIATYIASLQQAAPPKKKADAAQILSLADKAGLGMINTSAGHSQAAMIYASSCGWCHYNANNKGEFFASRQKIALGIGANAPVPANLVHVILDGVRPVEGVPSPIMPGFAGALTKTQIVELVKYIRAHFTDKPAWRNVAKSVAAAQATAGR